MTDILSGTVTEDGKLTSNSTTVIYPSPAAYPNGTSATTIRSLTITENTGAATPAATLEKFDGTNAYAIRTAVAMTAGTQVVYNEPFVLPMGWFIRAKSGDASGKIDWSVTYDTPDKRQG